MAYELANSGVYGLTSGGVYRPLTIIDDFEDGGISEYSGDTGAYSATTTSPVVRGSYSLKASLAGGAGSKQIYSTAGLSNYLQQDETAEWRTQLPTGSVTTGITYFVQDGSNYYLVQVDGINGNLKLFVKSGGSYTELAASAVTVPRGELLYADVTPKSDGTHTATLYDASRTQLASISATDTTYTSGGNGHRAINNASSSKTMVFDLVHKR